MTNSCDDTSDTTVEYGISVDLKVYCDHLEHELDEVVSNQHNFDNHDEKTIDFTESTICSEIEFINNICKDLQQDISDFTKEAFVDRRRSHDPPLEQWLDDLLDDVEKETSYLDLEDSEIELEVNEYFYELSGSITKIGELEDGEITDIKLDEHSPMNLSDQVFRSLEAWYMDDGVKVNSFERKIMYATALLTQSHVFDDDSPASSFDITSEGESNGDEVKDTESEASEPGLRNSETIVEDQVLCRNKIYSPYSSTLGLPYVTIAPEIDPEPPPIFESKNLPTSHTQYETQTNSNEYVSKVGIFRRPIDHLKVVGWRYNCWEKYIESGRSILHFRMICAGSTKVEMTHASDYYYINSLFCCKRYYGEIGLACLRILYRFVHTLIHDNLRSMRETEIISLIEVWQWTKAVVIMFMQTYIWEIKD